MIKRILLFLAIALLGGAIAYFLNTTLISPDAVIPFSLLGMYAFHLVAFLVVIVSIELLNTILPNQVGYGYLASIFIKVGVFVLIYKEVISNLENYDMPIRLSIVVPMFIFLAIEAVYCGRLMNNQ